MDAVIDKIGHSQPHLEWLHAPETYKLFSNLVIQDLLADDEVGGFLEDWLEVLRNREMLRYMSSADPDEKLISGGIMASSKDAREKWEKGQEKDAEKNAEETA